VDDVRNGTWTFLFTDIVGSSALWNDHPEEMRIALTEHDAILRRQTAHHGGTVFKSGGDGICAVFDEPAAALRAAKLKVMQDKRWSNPYYWAGFVVQGEYTNHINIETNSRRNLGVIVILSLLLISCGLIILKVNHKSALAPFRG